MADDEIAAMMGRGHSGARYRAGAILMAAAFAIVLAMPGQAPAASLPTLTTARAAHGLTVDEAARGYPVHIQAVATYSDPYIDPRHGALFVHDSTGAIFAPVTVDPRKPILVGDIVDIRGVTGRGDFAPVIQPESVRVIGKSHVPKEAPRVSLAQMSLGKYDGQWVEVEGVIRNFREFGHNVNMEIAMSDGLVTVTTVKEDGADYSRLVDATVVLHGNEAPIFNSKLQLTGVRLMLSGLDQLRVEEAPAADPFAMPLLPVSRILRYNPEVIFRHRVHVRGRVTLQWPGRSLCIQDGGDGLCVQTTQDTRVELGQVVDLAGFPAIGGLLPTLNDTTIRPADKGTELPARNVTAEEALRGGEDSKLIQLEGMLVTRDRSAKDPTLVLSTGNFVFPVVFPEGASSAALPEWEDGSVLRVTGICGVNVAHTDILRQGLSVPASFRVLLRSPSDITVVKKASWWTAAHSLSVVGGALVLALCALGWVVALRNRVAEQTKLIQRQNERLHGLSFQDGLTGVANRRKFDETLPEEFASAAERRQPVSLLMVDIDHFKALNDEYGHQRGDECIVQVARALVESQLRSTDLVSRYGGEEFTVILPGCEEACALAVAERMREAVFSLGIVNNGSGYNRRVSVSIGAATVYPAAGATPDALIAMADRALYQSKVRGRNRTTLADELVRC